MMTRFIAAAALLAATATAQTPATPPSGAAYANACPTGTRYATIRHSMVKPGQMALFTQAVADHNAWYAGHHDASQTHLVRMLAAGARRGALSETEAATITVYAPTPMPARDAGYSAFTAKYKASSTMKDEMRLCLPPLGK